MTDFAKIDQKRRAHPWVDPWTAIAGLIATLVLLPLLVVLALAFFPTENVWPHLISTVLPRYLINSLVLMCSVALFAGIIGVGSAWLVVMYRFPGRTWLEWALLLPLAVPAYIGAYAFVDLFEYAGPVQTALRNVFGWTSARDYWFPELRSMGGAIFVITLSLYPYVYLLARAAYREQSNNAIEVSRALGCGPWGCFLRVGLPLSRPAIVAGMAVVMMETLNDFGTVEFFAVQTLTTGIFTTWLEGSNIGSAAQIACTMFALIMGLVMIERYSRRKLRVRQLSRSPNHGRADTIKGPRRWAASILCAIPVLFGFVMPFLILLKLSMSDWSLWANHAMLSATWTTLWVAGTAALATVSAALILIYAVRLSRSHIPRLLAPITSVGYVMPGAVLGLGVVITLGWFDHWLADTVERLSGLDIGLVLTGSAFAVIFAYTVRFFALAFGSIDAGFGRVSPNLGAAARSLGLTPSAVLTRVHMPILRTTILAALLLVFVDSVKELPATLLLRPFGFNTLATHVYNSASIEDLKSASVGAMMIIIVGIIAVIILAKSTRGSDR